MICIKALRIGAHLLINSTSKIYAKKIIMVYENFIKMFIEAAFIIT